MAEEFCMSGRNPGRTNVSDWYADVNAQYGRDKSA
jgi:hypothetical protein